MIKLTWLLIAMIWGTIRVIIDRSGQSFNFPDVYGSSELSGSDADISIIISQENAWGFGQVIAMLLLGLPLLSFSEVVYGKTKCKLILIDCK